MAAKTPATGRRGRHATSAEAASDAAATPAPAGELAPLPEVPEEGDETGGVPATQVVEAPGNVTMPDAVATVSASPAAAQASPAGLAMPAVAASWAPAASSPARPAASAPAPSAQASAATVTAPAPAAAAAAARAVPAAAAKRPPPGKAAALPADSDDDEDSDWDVDFESGDILSSLAASIRSAMESKAGPSGRQPRAERAANGSAANGGDGDAQPGPSSAAAAAEELAELSWQPELQLPDKVTLKHAPEAIAGKEVGLARALVVPPRDPSAAANKAARRAAPATAGKGWYDLPATQITDEVKRDLRLLKLRCAWAAMLH